MPVKVLNVSDKNVNIGRNNVIAYFEPLNDHVISNLSENDALNMCANVCVNNTGGESSESLEKFMTNFTVNAELHADEKITLQNTLWANKDCFVTAENPDIGVTNIVQHTIHLKPDAISKHHKPYRLPPEKREVLRHQLDELLRQGIIVPVNENEDLPITSPIVLISKRNKPVEKPESITKEYSMTSYRFCCDFRYLNSQSQDFRYNIPNLQ